VDDVSASRRRSTSNVTWDGRVEEWEAVSSTPVFQQLARRVLAEAAPAADDHVLDLGAGTGLLTLALAPVVKSVIAIDASVGMLGRLEARARQLEFLNVAAIESDLRDLPLPDESISLAVSSYAFHHLDGPGKELALAEVRRVLRPGGRVVICDMMFALSLAARDRKIVVDKALILARKGPSGLVRLARNAARAATGRWEHPSSPEIWRQMLEQRAFEQIRVTPVLNEAAIASARRPQLPHKQAATHET
jgi:ubiquinone/menaquinone biosynthesis C-methylase UbiE